jgi:hypothetical protein
VSSESSFELVPGDSTNIVVRVAVRFPPFSGGSKELMCCKKHFLLISTLCNLQLFSIDLSQCSASIGSLACEKVVGRVLKNSPSLD